MKKFLCLAAFTVAVFSCQQEEVVETLQEGQSVEPVRLVQVVNGTQMVEVGALATRSADAGNFLLQFDSEATYQSFLDRLKNMSHKERMALVESYGLVSLQQVSVWADQELEQIGKDAASEADFKIDYEQYKAKYEGVLVSNEYDETDLSLYVPDGSELATYVVNSHRQVAIGNSIKNVALADDMGESDKAVYAMKPNSAVSIYPENNWGFIEQYDSKKTIGSVTVEASSGIKIHVGFQKKMWYGWKRDNARDAYVGFSAPSSQMHFTYEPRPGQIVSRPNPYDLYVYYDPGTVDFYVGGLQPGNKLVNGTFYLWNDHNAGTQTRQYNEVLINGALQLNQTLPICDPNTAYGGNFSIYYNY